MKLNNRYAVIDMGTNAIKLLIAEVTRKKTPKVLIDQSIVCRLGEGLHSTGEIGQAAINRCLDILKRCLEEINDFDVQKTIAIGTMCLRVAKNSQYFLDQIKNQLGIDVQVISGEQEAKLSYISTQAGLPLDQKNVLVFDIGGGSTEFIRGSGSDISGLISTPIGTVTLTERFLLSDPVPDDQLLSASDFIKKLFTDTSSELPSNAKLLSGSHFDNNNNNNNDDQSRISNKIQQVLVSLGGTLTTMGSVSLGSQTYDPNEVHGKFLSLEEVNRQVELYQTKTIVERKSIPGMIPARADIILAGALIVKTVMELTGNQEILISHNALRHGVFYDQFIDQSSSVITPLPSVDQSKELRNTELQV